MDITRQNIVKNIELIEKQYKQFGLPFVDYFLPFETPTMVVLEGGGSVVTIGSNQYLQPDYLAPTTVSSLLDDL